MGVFNGVAEFDQVVVFGGVGKVVVELEWDMLERTNVKHAARRLFRLRRLDS